MSNEEKVSPDILETLPSSQPEVDQASDGDPTDGPQKDAEASKVCDLQPKGFSRLRL